MNLKEKVSICVVVLYGFAMGLSEFVVIGIEPELAESFAVTLDTVGLSISLFALAYALCTPILTFTTGRFRRYTLMLAYGAVMLLGNFVSILAASFELLLACRMLIGAVSGAMLALCITFVPELIPEKYVPIGISAVYGSYSIAMVIVAPLGRLAAVTVGWKVMMVGVFVANLIETLLAAVILPKMGKTDEPATAREQFALIKRPRVILGMLTFVFGVSAVYVFYGYITPYMEHVLGLQPTSSSLLLAAYGVVCFVSNMMGGVFDMRWGFKSLVGNFICLGLSLLGLWLCQSNTALSVVCMMCIALFMYSLATPLVSMFMDQAYTHCPKGITLAASLDPMTFNIGITLGTFAGGAIIVGPGIENAGLYGSVLALGALCLVVASIRQAKREATQS